MNRTLIIFAAWLAMFEAGCAQQITLVPAIAPPSSIMVSANPTTLIVGGTSILAAQLTDGGGNPNVDITDRCTWTSSNAAVLSVAGNVATGVAAGSATANCRLGTLSGSTPVSISVSTIVFTTPTQASCANPCIITGGRATIAYSFTFAASSSAGGPYTWDCNGSCAGIFPSGLSLSSAGVLSGTTAVVGTTNWTVRVTDGVSNTATLPVSLTMVPVVTCGPPTYPCSSTTTANPGTITAPFSSTVPTGTVTTSNSTIGGCTPTGSQSCVQVTAGTNFVTTWPATKSLSLNGGSVITVVSWNSTTVATVTPQQGAHTGYSYTYYGACITGSTGCQNATGYDTTLNASGTDCMTQMTDQSVTKGGSFNGTPAGGDYENLSSVNEHFLAAYTTGGVNRILYVNPTGNCLQVVNTGDLSSTAIISGEIGFSRVLDSRFFYTTNVSQIWQGDIPLGTANSVNSGGNSVVTFASNNASAPPLSSWTGKLAVNYVSYPIVSCTSSSCTITGNTGTLTGVPYAKPDAWIGTEIADLMASGVCPGVVPFTAKWGSVLTVTLNDGQIDLGLGPANQGSADWTFAYSKTLGCKSRNMATGQGWGYLAPGTCSTAACSEAISPLVNSVSGLGTMLNYVNTTSTGPGIIGTTELSVGSNNNMFVGQLLTIDTGANQEVVSVIVPHPTDCGSCFKATFTKTHAAGVAVTYTPSSCWGSNGAAGNGMHDQQGSVDGTYFSTGPNPGQVWTGGGCAISPANNQFSIVNWTSLDDQFWYADGDKGFGGPSYDNHPIMGVTHALSFLYSGLSQRLIADGSAFTVFAPGGIVQDSHYGQPYPTGDDSYQPVGATDSMLTTQGSGCALAITCPTNQVNVVQSFNQNGTYPVTPTQFVHTYSGGPAGTIFAHPSSGQPDPYFGGQYSIGFVTAKGNFFCWVSTMLQGLGLDNSGKQFTGLFCARLQ